MTTIVCLANDNIQHLFHSRTFEATGSFAGRSDPVEDTREALRTGFLDLQKSNKESYVTKWDYLNGHSKGKLVKLCGREGKILQNFSHFSSWL